MPKYSRNFIVVQIDGRIQHIRIREEEEYLSDMFDDWSDDENCAADEEGSSDSEMEDTQNDENDDGVEMEIFGE